MISRLFFAATTLALLPLMHSLTAAPVSNTPVPKIDPARFAGKWYSLMSIPTFLDKNWRETIEHYTPRPKGGFDVFTTYRKADETKTRAIKSILFPVKGGPDGEFRAQFFWPIKVPYIIVELPKDYSYMVGGSPDKKMLFIMSRTPTLPKVELEAILARCKARGYAIDQLTSQEQRPEGTPRS